MRINCRYTDRFIITLIMLSIGYLLTGCSNEMEQFIQGKWAAGDVHYWVEWNFDRGYFTYYYDYDNNRSNITQTGRYSIIESGEDYLLLELYNQQGGIQSIEERVELHIGIDREEDTLTIRRQQFNRVATSSLGAVSTARAP